MVDLHGLGMRMDLICPLRALLDPLAEHLSIVLDGEDPLHPGSDTTPRILEGHATLGDGRVALFGFYQHASRRTIAAEMWVTDGAARVHHDSRVGSVGRRRQAWSYDPATDAVDLARAIVADVLIWLQAFDQASEPAREGSLAHA